MTTLDAARAELDALLAQPSPFLAYAYSYPHKTAYRPLTPPVSLARAWQDEPEDNDTALYVHIPFCEMRCGFCNLFTIANPEEEAETVYLEALERQADTVRAAIGQRRFSRAAFGGGTPTFLSVAGLERALRLAARFTDLAAIPFSVETSPRTAASEPEKLDILRRFGVDRISIGVQSFVEAEARAAGRGQQNAHVFSALEAIRAAGFPTLNIDLIYGLPGQTPQTWEHSLRETLAWAPEEVYLYPLYVRPLTGLDARASAKQSLVDDAPPPEQQLGLYREARALLLSGGYEQVSLRFFRKCSSTGHPSSDAAGGNLVGLGCGARSYAGALHYSSEWAVRRGSVRGIIADYGMRTAADFAVADYGVWLTEDEQKRRFLIYSLLQQAEGASLCSYRARFGVELLTDYPSLSLLAERGLATCDPTSLRLTERGWERADVLGPWLTSPSMRARMETFSLR